MAGKGKKTKDTAETVAEGKIVDVAVKQIKESLLKWFISEITTTEEEVASFNDAHAGITGPQAEEFTAFMIKEILPKYSLEYFQDRIGKMKKKEKFLRQLVDLPDDKRLDRCKTNNLLKEKKESTIDSFLDKRIETLKEEKAKRERSISEKIQSFFF